MKSENSKSQKSLESNKSEAKHHRCHGTQPFSTNSGGEKRLNICTNGGFKGTVCSCAQSSHPIWSEKSPYIKMLAIRFVVVTELEQDEVLTARADFKAVFTCSNVLPSD